MIFVEAIFAYFGRIATWTENACAEMVFCDKITERSIEKFKTFDYVSITFLASAFGKDRILLMISFVIASVITLYNIVRFRQTSNLFTTLFQDIANIN